MVRIRRRTCERFDAYALDEVKKSGWLDDRYSFVTEDR
jgi:hypothetical protein